MHNTQDERSPLIRTTSRGKAGRPTSRRAALSALVPFLFLLILLAGCNPQSLSGLPIAIGAGPAANSTTVAGPAPGTATAQPTPGLSGPSSGSRGATAATSTPEPPSGSAQAASTAGTAPGNEPSAATTEAIKAVIQKGNQEEVQAFASGDPSVMADTATSAYYQQMAQSYQQMVQGGITAIKLLDLKWGTIALKDPNTAEANTTETWLTTFSDGSSMQETDPNVYALVLQGGSWKVQDDQHPDSRTLQPQGGAGGLPGQSPTSGPGAAAPTSVAPVLPQGSGVEQSSNWAGYTATGGTFTGVSGSWTVPNVTAGTGNSVASDATWVGVGGVDTTDLIQAGTQAEVQSGQVVYSAWWETLPQAAQMVPLDIKAGDKITVSITRQTGATWLIVIQNATSGQSFKKSMAYDSSLSSAEWIEESPTIGRRTLLPLDNFGSVTFTGATATENGKQRTLAQAGGQPITMYSSGLQGRLGRRAQGGQGGQPLAQPSAIGSDGASFTVTRTNVASPGLTP